MEEMSRITQPETSDEISDENQNKLKETKAMDVDTDKHDSENRNTEENALESNSCSLDHGKHSILLYYYIYQHAYTRLSLLLIANK